MPKKTRKRFTAQEKVAILRLPLLEHTPISDLCDRHGIHPTMFSRWQKESFENAAAACEPRARRAGDSKVRRIALLGQLAERRLAEMVGGVETVPPPHPAGPGRSPLRS